MAWLLKEYGNSQFVPMSTLLAHLQQEIQVRDSNVNCYSVCHNTSVEYSQCKLNSCMLTDNGCMTQHVDALEAQQMQAAGFQPGGEGLHDAAMGDQHKHARHSFSQQLMSPVKRQANTQGVFYNFGHNANVELPENGQAYGLPTSSAGYSFLPPGHQ